MWTNIIQNLIFKGLISQFKIAATTQYITRIKDSTKNIMYLSLAQWLASVASDYLTFNPMVTGLNIIYNNIRDILRVSPDVISPVGKEVNPQIWLCYNFFSQVSPGNLCLRCFSSKSKNIVCKHIAFVIFTSNIG